jgi:hypothetical protein
MTVVAVKKEKLSRWRRRGNGAMTGKTEGGHNDDDDIQV